MDGSVGDGFGRCKKGVFKDKPGNVEKLWVSVRSA